MQYLSRGPLWLTSTFRLFSKNNHYGTNQFYGVPVFPLKPPRPLALRTALLLREPAGNIHNSGLVISIQLLHWHFAFIEVSATHSFIHFWKNWREYKTYKMNRRAQAVDGRFSPLSMALNALERSRANERLLTSYKCPCTLCKGGGRPVLRLTIETHLRRHGRDPTLQHCTLVSPSLFFAHLLNN